MARLDNIVPGFDVLDGFDAPWQQNSLFGHRKAINIFLDAHNRKRLHHAWLISGARGVGKSTLAYRLTRFILASTNEQGTSEDPTSIKPEHPVARQISSLVHPNMLVISRPWDAKGKKYRTEITIDEVRKTNRFFGTTSGNGKWRICIVDAADDLNRNAANALLKILEEPPRDCLFFVLSHAPGRLLPTIRSRCRKLALEPLGRDDMSSGIQHFTGLTDPDILDRLTNASDGRLRRALELNQSNGTVVIDDLASLIKSTRQQATDFERLHGFAELISKPGQGDTQFQLLLESCQRTLSLSMRQLLSSGASQQTLMTHAKAWENIGRIEQNMRIYNLDKKQAVIDIVRCVSAAVSN